MKNPKEELKEISESLETHPCEGCHTCRDALLRLVEIVQNPIQSNNARHQSGLSVQDVIKLLKMFPKDAKVRVRCGRPLVGMQLHEQENGTAHLDLED